MTELQEVEDEMRKHPDPVVTVPDLTEELGASDTHIRDLLRLLERAGAVESKDVGARATAWWHVDRVAPPHVPPAEHPDQSALEDAAAPDDAHSAVRDDAPDALDDVDFPSSREREECVEAVLAARQYLRESGYASMREIVADVMPEHPIGYDIPDLEPGERYRGAWWRLVVKPGLKAFPDVESPKPGASEWAISGDSDE